MKTIMYETKGRESVTPCPNGVETFAGDVARVNSYCCRMQCTCYAGSEGHRRIKCRHEAVAKKIQRKGGRR